jgi:hypothetical protein
MSGARERELFDLPESIHRIGFVEMLSKAIERPDYKAFLNAERQTYSLTHQALKALRPADKKRTPTPAAHEIALASPEHLLRRGMLPKELHCGDRSRLQSQEPRREARGTNRPPPKTARMSRAVGG